MIVLKKLKIHNLNKYFLLWLLCKSKIYKSLKNPILSWWKIFWNLYSTVLYSLIQIKSSYFSIIIKKLTKKRLNKVIRDRILKDQWTCFQYQKNILTVLQHLWQILNLIHKIKEIINMNSKIRLRMWMKLKKESKLLRQNMKLRIKIKIKLIKNQVGLQNKRFKYKYLKTVVLVSLMII
jgi:hypothetical protein